MILGCLTHDPSSRLAGILFGYRYSFIVAQRS